MGKKGKGAWLAAKADDVAKQREEESDGENEPDDAEGELDGAKGSAMVTQSQPASTNFRARRNTAPNRRKSFRAANNVEKVLGKDASNSLAQVSEVSTALEQIHAPAPGRPNARARQPACQVSSELQVWASAHVRA